MDRPDIDSLIKEYQQARSEPDFDGLKLDRIDKLQKLILEYLFDQPAVEGLEEFSKLKVE